MTNPLRNLVSLAMLAALGAPGQSTGFEPKDWKQTAPVNFSGGGLYGVLRLDAGAWRATESSLKDLRLRDAAGAEMPYVLREPSATGEETGELRPLLYDRVVTPRGDLQFLLDFGENSPIHNSMRMRWSDRNFRRRMRIESSENGRKWDLVKETTLLDFESDGQVFRTEDVDYPPTSRRYLRVQIEGWKDAGALVSLVSRYVQSGRNEWVDLGPVPFQAAKDAQQPGTQAIDATLPFAAPEQMRLLLEVPGSDFIRTVELKAELPGQRWVTACSGAIANVGETKQPWVECNVVLARKLRAVIRNGNDSELNIRGVRVLAPVRELIFELRPARPFRLYAGNEQARTPVYDLGQRLRTSPAIDPQPASLGAWKPNPEYEPPVQPVSEKARGWLTALLGVILLGIVLTARFLLKIATRRSRRYS